MKKALLMMAALIFAHTTFAQTAASATTPIINPEKVLAEKVQMKKLCDQIRAYNNKRAEAKLALVKGNLAAAKLTFAEAKADKQDIKVNAQVLKNEGITHPMRLAHRELKKIDKKNIEADVKVIMADKIAEKAAIKAGNTTDEIADIAAIKTDKTALRKDLKEAKRDAGWHIAFIRNNHLSHI